MSEGTTSPVSYLADGCVMPFCKGCGHTHVVRRLDEALRKLQLDPHDVCLVSDIGCIGLVDSLFKSPHTVHTTHGRSTAFATGIEIADSVLGSSALKTIVLIGDGGAMIGLLHLVHAALLNVDVTVLLCNNFLFGMTGGQNSAFSPLDFVTPTTPEGNMVPPVDMCRIMVDAHAGFVARKLATDGDLVDTIRAAIAHPGFALVEIIELCTEYGVKNNELTGSKLRSMVEANGQEFGILADAPGRDEFGKSYSSKFRNQAGAESPAAPWLRAGHEHRLDRELKIVLAGSAGERVQSAAAALCEASAMARLHCTMKTDNPVTQGSGFSCAEVKLSPDQIRYTGIDEPDVVVVASNDGWAELVERGTASRISAASVVLADASLKVPDQPGVVYRIPFRSICKPEFAAAAAIMFYLTLDEFIPSSLYLEVLKAKQRLQQEPFPDEFLALLENARRERAIENRKDSQD